jgi:hypothetical protein
VLGAAVIPMWSFLNRYLRQVSGYGALAGGAALTTGGQTDQISCRESRECLALRHVMSPFWIE